MERVSCRSFLRAAHLTLDRAWMVTPGSTARIPAAVEGAAALRALDATVPGRGRGRENWHRERHCIVGLLRWLHRRKPAIFPALLARCQAPDFLLYPANMASPLAIEHTDLGNDAYHRRLDAFAAPDAPRVLHFDVPDDPIGDLPERDFAHDIGEALRRKLVPKIWRNAPARAERWLLLYDNSELGRWVDQRAAQALVKTALCSARPVAALHAIALVRTQARVLVAERKRSPQ